MFLSCKSQMATAEDLPVARDLADTLRAHAYKCVGMAANMIGVNKRIIVFENDGEYMVMFNPVIAKKSAPYDAEEGCLSLTGTRNTRRWQEGCLALDGERPCLRYQQILMEYQDEQLQRHVQRFSGFTAQVIQHEVDHLEGIII